MEHSPDAVGMEAPISSPTTIKVGSEGGEETEEATTPKVGVVGGGQDWQLVDDGLLSQCGSSPGSLSHKDLEVACEMQLPSDESPELASKGEGAILPVSDVCQAPEEAAALGGDLQSQGFAEMRAAFEGLIDAGIVAGFQDESQEGATSSPTVPQLVEEATANEDLLMSSLGAPLSGRSSYANVSLPNEEHDEGEEDVEVSEGALLDMLEEIGMDAEVDTHSQSSVEDDLDYPSLDIPDNGVFSIATGYPMGTPFQSAGSRPLSFARLSSELPDQAMGAASDALSSAGSTGISGRIPTPRAHSDAEKDCWAVWRHRAASGRAGVLLHQLWRHVQRVAGHLPIGVRRRVAGILRHMAKGGAHTCVAYGTALLGFWLAWHYYSRTRALERLTASQSHDYDMHVLKVLAINEGLSRGTNIPITRHCGFKTHNLGLSRMGGYSYPHNLGISGARLYD